MLSERTSTEICLSMPLHVLSVKFFGNKGIILKICSEHNNGSIPSKRNRAQGQVYSSAPEMKSYRSFDLHLYFVDSFSWVQNIPF